MADNRSQAARVVPFRLTAKTAEKQVRELAADSANVIFGDHAQERMYERGITDVQVMEILRTGFVNEQPERTEYDEWKCKIVKELRGRRVAGVIAVILHEGRLFLKTVEWEDVR